MKKNWHAVYTKPLCEKKVVATLTKRKIESYCPLNSTLRQGIDQRKLIYNPLFTSFVFVQIAEAELNKVKEIEGVINLIYWLDKPAVIANEEIETIKLFLREYRNVKLERTPVNIDANVQIINEPVVNEQGNSITVKNRMRAVLPSLGYILVAEGLKSNVEILNASSVQRKIRLN